jgi:hypothetical protein
LFEGDFGSIWEQAGRTRWESVGESVRGHSGDSMEITYLAVELRIDPTELDRYMHTAMYIDTCVQMCVPHSVLNLIMGLC